MGTVRLDVTMSLNGFVAGPEDDVEHPLGLRGGERLHDWLFTFGDLGPDAVALEQIRVVDAPGITHILYRVER